LSPEELKSHSESYVERKRLSKSNFPDEKYKQNMIDKEYLNFDKYEKNWMWVEDRYDENEEDHEGLPLQMRKLREGMRKLKLDSAKTFHDEEIDNFW